MSDIDLIPITDWSLSGRKEYVSENRTNIELVIERGVETLADDVVSKVFGSIEKIPDEIIKRFLVPELDSSIVPSHDLHLFSEINFWIKHKTGGRASSRSYRAESLDQTGLSLAEGNHEQGACAETRLNQIIKSLETFNSLVAPDVIGYWMMANKKLLDSFLSSEDHAIEHRGSEAKKTKYKADASFRFCYHFLKLNEKLSGEHNRLAFESKYLVKGPNKPQYVSGNEESHALKHNVRIFIKKVILFYEAHCIDYDELVHCLIKPMTKKSLLDQYEFDKESIDEYGIKLKSLLKTKEVM